jgi:hypothetical protein
MDFVEQENAKAAAPSKVVGFTKVSEKPSCRKLKDHKDMYQKRPRLLKKSPPNRSVAKNKTKTRPKHYKTGGLGL